MTSLDAVEIAASEKPPEPIMHQWAYSFMPVESTYQGSGSTTIYLVGYCKGCRTSFTAALDRSDVHGKVMITETNVPKFGCVGPFAGI